MIKDVERETGGVKQKREKVCEKQKGKNRKNIGP